MPLDFIAGITELLGLWVVGNKKSYGFIINLVCNILWIIFVLANKTTYGLLLVVIPAIFINVRNYLHWRRHESNIISKR